MIKSIITTLAALLFCAGISPAQTYTTNVVTSVSTNANGQVIITQTETINVIPAPVTNVVVVVQTNGVVPAPPITAQSFLTTAWNDFKGATNYAIAPYATYAPKAPTKIGAGILGIYNVNNYVGAGLGLDWLGGFSMVSGNIQLKLPINLEQFIAGATNFSVVPFALGGLGAPFSGGSGVSIIEDVGAYAQFGHLWGGQFVLGASYGKWMGSGPYDVTRYHGFLGWMKGF